MTKVAVLKCAEDCFQDEYPMSLLALCESMHMVVTGSADARLSDKDVRAALSFLRRRLECWKSSPGGTTIAYDNAVRQLIGITISEWAAWEAERQR
jgi:hypothetical protein